MKRQFSYITTLPSIPMKLEPPKPLDEDTLPKTKNRGCAPMVMLVIAIALLATLVFWVLLWSGGANEAQDEAVKPTTKQAAAYYDRMLLAA